MTEGNFIARRHPVFLASLLAQGQCLLVQKVDPAAQPFIEENQYM
jgi:hypothetical protein